MIYLTSDCHGDFTYIKDFVVKNRLTREDTIIILGDSGLYFRHDDYELTLRERIAKLPVNFLILHGNKEERVSHFKEYSIIPKYNGNVYFNSEYPNLYFAIDGESYIIENKKILTVGGACSILAHCSKDGELYWKDEIPNIKELKNKIKFNKYDYILTHTSPLNKRPQHIFANLVDESLLDFSLESYFDELENRLTYKKWFCGHYHINFDSEKFQIIYKEFVKLQ